MLSAEQNICLGAKIIENGIETMACDVATEDKRTQEKCHEGFKALGEILEGTCDIAFSQMCNPEACPQNYHQSICVKKNSFELQREPLKTDPTIESI